MAPKNGKKSNGGKKPNGNKPNGGKKPTGNKKTGGKFVRSKPPTLKQKNARQNKIIKADQLLWKPVEIPDNLGDYSGFFGLEELEGVDVRMVNGKAEFIAKDSDVEMSEEEEEEQEEGEEKEEPAEEQADAEEEQAEAEGEEEFTGFDDEVKLDQQEKKSQKKASKTENKKNKKDKNDIPEKDDAALEKEDEEEKLVAFSVLDMPLPDDDIDLPQWQNVPLSAYTLSGLQALGFKQPTPIQKSAIPLALEGKDVIGKATTGSGKTLAYGIPILEKYISKIAEIKTLRQKKTIPAPTGIIFAPTRELAHQVLDHLNKIAKYAPLALNGIVSVTGGLSIQRQERLLSYGPGIIVATPGRFLELIEKSEEFTKRMALTEIIVLDEADRLLQDGHFEEFERILDLLGKNRDKAYGWRWQTLVFSATFSRDLFFKLDKSGKGTKASSGALVANDEILQLLQKKLKFKDSKPALCDANPKEIVSGQITEALVECGPAERDLYLYYFVLMYPGSTLVFANSVESVRRLVPLLENLNIPAFSIHSSMIQKQRMRALERFKEATQKNKSAVLVATDVAARGLDIPSIDHVAHYHLPRSADTYIHRSGRTARAGKEGVSVMFCSPQEASGPFKKLRKLVASSAEGGKFNAKADVKLLPIEYDIVQQIRERVRMAGKLAGSTMSNTATRKENSWLKQAAEDLGFDNLSDLDEFEDDVIKKQKKRLERSKLTKEEQKALRAQLKESLAIPLRKNHRRSYITSGLENLAHQIVSGATSETVLGRKSVKALDELKQTKGKARVEKKKQKQKQKARS